MEKLKEYKYIILISLIVLGAAFYWFEYRPSHIKHVCSWEKKHHDLIPAWPGLTNEEKNTQITKCNEESNSSNQFIRLFADSCIKDVEKDIAPRPAVPAWDEWVTTSDTEYKFCLRNKGL